MQRAAAPTEVVCHGELTPRGMQQDRARRRRAGTAARTTHRRDVDTSRVCALLSHTFDSRAKAYAIGPGSSMLLSLLTTAAVAAAGGDSSISHPAAVVHAGRTYTLTNVRRCLV